MLLNVGTYIILKGALIHGIPTVHYGTVKTLIEQKQIQMMTNCFKASSQISYCK